MTKQEVRAWIEETGIIAAVHERTRERWRGRGDHCGSLRYNPDRGG